MCGIAGYLGFVRDDDGLRSQLYDMGAAIQHRGPDDRGVWIDRNDAIGLVHQRLSILDLSPAGHQPMRSPSSRYVAVFNGEIYNHTALRLELQTRPDVYWSGHSDTETLLTGFDQWGIGATLERTTGMFAIAIWDRRERRLTLARDRIGEKPLYYGWQGNTFLFGSELKALRAHCDFKGEINHDVLALYMRHNYVPAPYSIYNGINKLMPGTILDISLAVREPKLRKYWSLGQTIAEGIQHPFQGDTRSATAKLEELLRASVSQQMIADVPLGAFLSGGVDSSTVVALMQSQSSRPVKTFSIGFTEELYNEAQYAKEIASHLGTDHTEWYVSARDAQSMVPKLGHIYDEPFSDSSQIPTLLVSQMARRHVTVSLSGDAGDELFCGYNRYVLTAHMWRQLSVLPPKARKTIATILLRISPSTWNRLAGPLQWLLPKGLRQANIGDKIHKGADVMASRSISELYRGLISHWKHPESLVIGAVEPGTILSDNSSISEAIGDIERMMALDTTSYLPDDILCKVDRAAMHFSLETRVPLLDHRVVEFVWRLPLSYKLRDGVSKWILRQVLYKYVPSSLVDRPKMGFGIPIDAWLRGPLRDWAEELLSEARLRREGYFDPQPIRVKWIEHQSGKRNWQYHLWDVLVFQEWLEANRKY
jgi:asparagine synthase (glutamine-hydrolysing)